VAPKQPTVTETKKKARLKKPETKATLDPKPASVKPKMKAAASVEIATTKPTTPKLVVPPQVPPPHSRKSLISRITFPSKYVWS
jgi:hypothetical protein